MKTKLFLLLLVSGVLFSCTEDSTLSSLIQTKMNSDIYVSVIDTSSIVDIRKVEHIVQLFQKNELSTRTIDSGRVIKSINAVKNYKGDVLMYVVNYKDNKGFVIISATQEYQPILAYSDNGSFDLENIEQTGASVWLNEQKSIITSIDKIPDSIKQSFRMEWIKYNTLKVKLAKTRSENDVLEMIHSTISKWQNEGYTVYRFNEIQGTSLMSSLPSNVKNMLGVASQGADPRYGGRGNNVFLLTREVLNYTPVGPLLETKWGQEEGFNQYTPKNYPVGCVAVAMGQIMRYHKYPLTFDWNSMSNSTATSVVAALLYDIGINVDMDYEANGSSSNIDKAISAFKNKYGYRQAVKIDHSDTKVISELRLNRPVYMRGYDSSGFLGFKHEGHAWVCDGFSAHDYYTELKVAAVDDYSYDGSEPTSVDVILTGQMNPRGAIYYHMNWGWYGNHNGSFLDSNLWMNTSEGPFNPVHGREDIINIYPSR